MRVGSLFSGYGGLDLAVGGELAWFSDVEPAAVTVMQAHNPGVPNLGDITQVDWKSVEPVDVLTGGYPCQPFSTAGKRKGTNDERHLWPYVRDAISALRPRVVVLENVRGHLTLGFASVLADLADLGLPARWGVVRASDAGAPHGRARLFIVTGYGLELGDSGHDAGCAEQWQQQDSCTCRVTESVEGAAYPSGTDWGNSKSHDLVSARPGTAELGERGGTDTWGTYTQAILRWEKVLGRTAPVPIVEGNGRDKLNPMFVEWMMGLPEGWVTGHGLSRSQELKLLGNGVVPQQAGLALELL